LPSPILKILIIFKGRDYLYSLTILLARLALFVILGLLNWSTLALAIPSIVPFLIAQPNIGQGSFYMPSPANIRRSGQ
jgi:uncharacterized membrane protein